MAYSALKPKQDKEIALLEKLKLETGEIRL